jgi:predicted alpha/beta-fold hydrolase
MADGSAILSSADTWGVRGEFSPPRWIRNPHVQSIAPGLPFWRLLRGNREVLAASRREIIDCGDGVRLLAERATPAANPCDVERTAVLLHGWEGSANSPDIVALAQHLFRAGFEVIRLNLRDHGETQALNPGLFHSCRLTEIVGAVQRLQQQRPRSRLSLVGFSLGGNFGLRVGAQARAEGLDLANIVAVCPVVDPSHALARLDDSAFYRRFFMRRWRRSLLLKNIAWPNRYDFSLIMRVSNLTEMADHFVRRHTGYYSLNQYLKSYSLVGDTLATLDTNTWLIAATDDPILPIADVDRLPTLDNLQITRTQFGGHCGFVEGKPGPSWLERSIERALSSNAS